MPRIPPKEYQFKPGQSGNPNGRPQLSESEKAAKREVRDLTLDSYREVIKIVFSGNVADLKAIVSDPESQVVRVAIATSVLTAIKKGDYSVIERIAERVVGKIPDVLNVNSKNFNADISAAIDPLKLKAALDKLESEV